MDLFFLGPSTGPLFTVLWQPQTVQWLLRPIRLWISAWIPSLLPQGKRCITLDLIQCGFFLSKVSSLCLLSLQWLQIAVCIFCVEFVLIFSRRVNLIKASLALLEVRTPVKVLIGEFKLFIMMLSTVISGLVSAALYFIFTGYFLFVLFSFKISFEYIYIFKKHIYSIYILWVILPNLLKYTLLSNLSLWILQLVIIILPFKKSTISIPVFGVFATPVIVVF